MAAFRAETEQTYRMASDEPLFDFSRRPRSAGRIEDMARALSDLQATRLVQSRHADETEAA